MKIKQFRFGDSNLAYLVCSGDRAAAIDGGSARAILDFLESESLILEYVLNTHEHSDHTPGNGKLLKETSAKNIRPAELCEIVHLPVGAERLEIFPTPGHTEDSIVFLADDWLITGDTLFNGTVGNCYTRDYERYFNSLEKILSFPAETRIFAGHDLIDYALGVAERIDPDNPYISSYRASCNPDFVYSTLKMELKVNPFVRFNDPSLDDFRKGLNMDLGSPYLNWRAMMSVH